MLIIQFHKPSLWKYTNHTNFILFAKMAWSNFRKTFLLFWHKIRCIVLNKKEKLFVKKKAIHAISIYGKCMRSIFLMATTKIFSCFFNRKLIFVLKQTFFEKKNFACKIYFFMCPGYFNIGFFSLSLLNFFQKRLKLFFCITCFCIPWSKSGNSKIKILEIIILEKFCQNLKVLYFLYITCVREN